MAAELEAFRIDPDRIDTLLGRAQAVQGRRITYKELAEKAGICAHTISGIRAGRTRGAGTTAIKLATAIRAWGVACSAESLLTVTSS